VTYRSFALKVCTQVRSEAFSTTLVEKNMTGIQGRRWFGYALMLLLPLAAAVLVSAALAANPNEREVKPEANSLDPDKVNVENGRLWVLDFKFKDPRIIKVDVPGRGQKVCWYLWFQVTNYTGQQRLLIPEFELKTRDKDTVHHDQVLPAVQDKIIEQEDPNGYLKIKNTVTISADPIPPTEKDAKPKVVTGVAIWDDVDAESNQYDIFVAGLSNGLVEADNPVDPAGAKVIRRKTLQLPFKRLGDKYYQKSEEIHFDGPAKWIYRASDIKVPGVPLKLPDVPKVP
jgi:hypothetical protein